MSAAESLDYSVTHIERLETAQKLVQSLQERENVGRLLHLEGDKFITAQNFEQALKCCQTSAQLALRAGDTYARGASQFHMGLYYFVCQDGDYDRAANLCQDAALIFHTVDPQRAEGVAYYAAARILQAACDDGQDRWEATLDNALRALGLLQNVQDLGFITSDFFYRFNKRYAEHLASTIVPFARPAASEEEPPTSADAPAAELLVPAAKTASPSTAAENVAVASGASAPPADKLNADILFADPNAPGAAPFVEPPSVGTRPRHFQFAAPSPRSAWVWYMNGLFGLVVFSLIIGAVLGVLYILERMPGFETGFYIGIASFVVATLVPFVILEFMGQLHFTGKPDVAAITLDSGLNRVYAYQDEATHALRPFRDLLVAWLSTGARRTERFAPAPLFMPSRGNAAQLTLQYRVQDPALVWSQIAGKFTPIKRFGIPFPIPATETEMFVAEYAAQCAAEQYTCMAPTLTKMSDSARSKRLCVSLHEQVSRTGILYCDVNVRTL